MLPVAGKLYGSVRSACLPLRGARRVRDSMIDDRRRRDEQRLRRAQEIAAALRERRAELLEDLRMRRHDGANEPIPLASYRRPTLWSLPDDVC